MGSSNVLCMRIAITQAWKVLVITPGSLGRPPYRTVLYLKSCQIGKSISTIIGLLYLLLSFNM